MWATHLRCPSCPQRWCVSWSGFCDKAVRSRGTARKHGERWSRWPGPLQGRQHAGEDFEPQIVFVAQAVGAALNHADLVVEPLTWGGSSQGGDSSAYDQYSSELSAWVHSFVRPGPRAFFRHDRRFHAPPRARRVKAGRFFRGHPKGVALTGRARR